MFTMSFLLAANLTWAQPSGGQFDFSPTSMSLTQYGIVHRAGTPPAAGSWAGIFDEDWNCVGASALIFNSGTAYFNTQVYEAEGTNEGIDCSPTCEQFKVVIWEADLDDFYILEDGGGAPENYDYEPDPVSPARIDAFSDFTQIWDFTGNPFDLDGALPVELAFFNGRLDEETVLLNWATYSETNNKSFTIEHSTDGKTFSPIGEVAGKGTTANRVDYKFAHDAPESGLNYYRLKQNDFDGRFEYSNVVVVKKEELAVSFFPNPATEFVQVKSEQPMETIRVFNNFGVLVKEFFVDGDEVNATVSLSDLTEGVYVVEVMIGSERLVERVLVEGGR